MTVDSIKPTPVDLAQAVRSLYAIIIMELDPDPVPVADYIGNTAAQKAATWAVGADDYEVVSPYAFQSDDEIKDLAIANPTDPEILAEVDERGLSPWPKLDRYEVAHEQVPETRTLEGSS